jgi:hypothetical protein
MIGLSGPLNGNIGLHAHMNGPPAHFGNPGMGAPLVHPGNSFNNGPHALVGPGVLNPNAGILPTMGAVLGRLRGTKRGGCGKRRV